MKKTSLIKNSVTIVLCISFLLSCSTKPSNKDESLILLDEIDAIESKSLNRDYYGILFTNKIVSLGETTTETFYVQRFLGNDSVPCLRMDVAPNVALYYYDCFSCIYYKEADMVDSVTKMTEEEINTLANMTSTFSDDLKASNYDISKIRIEKSKTDNLNTYALKLPNDINYFNTVTNSLYIDSLTLSFSDYSEITIIEKNNLIQSEEIALTFNIDGIEYSLHTKIELDYYLHPSIPSSVSQAINQKIKECLFNNELDFIRTSIDNKNGQKLKLISQNDDISVFIADTSRIWCDGTKYLLFADGNVLSVYDIKTYTKIKDIKFYSTITGLQASEGKIAVRLDMGSQQTQNQYKVYSLDDLSLITSFSGNIAKFSGNNIFYSEGMDYCQIDLKTKQQTVLYHCSDNLPDYYAHYIVYTTYFNQKDNILFVFYRNHTNLLIYFAIDTSTGEKLYQKETASVKPFWSSSDELWDGVNFAYEDCDKMIDSKTGSVIDYSTNKHNYRLNSALSDYTVYPMIIDERFDFLRLRKEIIVDKYYVDIQDMQYWFYDKQNDTLLAESPTYGVTNTWRINNELLIAYFDGTLMYIPY